MRHTPVAARYGLVRITRVRTGIDMRGVHPLRAKVRPKLGDAHLFLNKRLTIARVVSAPNADGFQVVTTIYAPKGRVFDFDAIQAAVGTLRVRLQDSTPRTRTADLRVVA